MKLTKVLTVIPAALLFGLGVVATLAPQQAYASSSSVDVNKLTIGKDFWFTFMHNSDAEATNMKLHVYVVANGATTVTLSKSDGTTLATKALAAAGDTLHYTIGSSQINDYMMTSSAKKESKGLHVTSTTADVAVYVASNYDNSAKISFDATPVLPTSVLGTEYVVQTYFVDKSAGEMAIVATADGTTNVKIVPNTEVLRDGGANYPANDTIRISMSRGQSLQLKGATKSFEVVFDEGTDDEYRENRSKNNLSGTVVVSDKPIAVFNGGISTSVPTKDGADGDHIFEQSIPVHAWGKRFIVSEMHGFADKPKVNASKATEYVLTAIYDNTVVYRNGEQIATLNRGETNYELDWDPDKGILVSYSDEPALIETSEPVICYGYTTNGLENEFVKGGAKNAGEPSMVLIPDRRQAVQSATFVTYDDGFGVSNVHHYINVVVPDTAVANMKLDGVDVSAQFKTTLSNHFQDEAGATWKWKFARIELTAGKSHVLSNDKGSFLAYAYGVQWGSARGYAMATTFNTAPSAPVVKIGDKAVEHNGSIDYCNRHPGVKFSAIVDYPHDGVRWDLGEGATSTSHNPEHMYGLVVNEDFKTHHLTLLVDHSSPITHVSETDTVHFDLNVYPAFYDTLKTKVAAKHKEFIWDKSSNNVFGLHNILGGDTVIDLTKKFGVPAAGAAEYDLVGRVAPLRYNAADSTKAKTKIWTSAYESALQWTDAHASFTLFDSLVYYTKLGPSCLGDGDCHCDSIFYLQLEVVPDIIKNDPDASVCQKETFTWAGHAAGTGHKVWQKNLTTNVSTEVTGGIITDVDGTFEIRDTMESKVFPYPDSIHVLKLTILPKPTITITNREDSICEADVPTWTCNYTADHCDSLYYWFKNSDFTDLSPAKKAGMRRTTETAFTISGLGSLSDGEYKVIVQTFNTLTGCVSEPDTVPFVLKNRPSLKLDPIAPQCYPAEKFVIKYSSSDAAKVKFYVDSIDGTPHKIAERDSLVNASKSFTVVTDGWPAGKYVLFTQPVSLLGCDSLWSHDTILIRKQPVITIQSIENQCDKETVTTLKFKTSDATQYQYKIGDGAWSATWTDVADGEHTISDFSISALTPGTYKLWMRAKSESCPSEEQFTEFEIYEMPTAKITAEAPTQCFTSISSDLEIAYERSGVTNKVDWQVTKGGDVVYSKDNETNATKLVIPADKLSKPGNYQVKITKAYSEYCDSTGLKKGTLDFVLYDTAHITLSDISPVCEGSAVADNSYTASSITSYKYWITKAGETVKGPFGPIATTGDGTIDMSSTATLSAGDYVLRVQAKNDGCGEASVISKPFTIHAIPSIEKVEMSDNSLCHKETPLPVVTIVNTTAGKLTYQIFKGATPWSPATTIDKPADNKITGLRTDTLSPGTGYVVKVTPKSNTTPSCTGTPVSSPAFEVNALPTLTIADIAAKCAPVSSFTVPYESEGAAYLVWKIDNGDWNLHNVPNSGDKQFVIDASTWDAGTYTLRVVPQSSVMCEGDTVVKIITINRQPSIGELSIQELCQKETSRTATYKNAIGATYQWRIDEGEWSTSQAIGEGGNGNFTVNKTLSAGQHTLSVMVKEGDCSATDQITFDVWPLPTVTLTTDNLDECYPIAAINVAYTSTNASKYSYTFTKDGASDPSDQKSNQTAQESGTIALNTNGLTAGSYTLSVTAVSGKECNIAEPATKTIKILPQPSLTLGSISNICEHTVSVSATVELKDGATKYNYDVLKNGVVMAGEHRESLTADAITLNTASWEPASYKLQVTAISDAGCGSVLAETEFTINPLPTITVNTTSATVCEGTEDASFNFTMTDTKWYKYQLGSGTTTEWTEDADGDVTIVLSKDDLTAGDFTLKVWAKSKDGCEIESEATASLKVNPQPKVGFAAAAIAKCEPINSIDVKYSPSNANSFTYTVKKGSSVVAGLKDVSVTTLTGTLTINTTDWEATTYTIEAQAKSADGCDGKLETKQFTIYPQPTAVINSVADACANQLATAVNAKITGATTYNYYIVRKSNGKTELGITDQPYTGADFNIDIQNIAAGEFRLLLVAKSATCESDTAKAEFNIYPSPTVTLNPNAIDVNIVYGTSQIVVPYTSSEAYQYTYTLVKNDDPSKKVGPTTVSAQAADDSIRIPSATLPVGIYTLTVNAVSEPGRDCAMPTAKTLTVEIYEPTEVEIDEPLAEDVCFGSADPIVMKVRTQYADTVWYVVTKSGTPITQEGKKFTNLEDVKVEHTFTLADVSGWEVGVYTVTFYAKNTVTGTQGSIASTFEIYQIPALTPVEPIQACLNKEKKVEITYPVTEHVIDSIAYRFVRGTTEYAASGYVLATGKLELNIEGHGVGEDTLYLQPKSKHSCEGGEVLYAKVVINPLPTLELDAVAAQCYADLATFNVGKTPTGADKITYVVKNASNEVVQAEQTIAATANMTVNPTSPSKWAAGTYTIEAYATSAVGCEGAKATTTFTIHPNPTISGLTVESQCLGAAETEATFECSIDEGEYDYKVYQKGSLLPTWTEKIKKEHQPITSSKSFTIDISSLDGPLIPLIDETRDCRIELVVRSADGCVSEKREATFYIYAKPQVTALASGTGCVGDNQVDVLYTSVFADTYSYTLEGVDVVVEPRVVAGTETQWIGSIPVNTAGLPAGTYKLTVIPSRTNPNCGGEDGKRSSTITLNPKPELAVAGIEDICANDPNDITTTITTLTNASNYSYVVLKNGSEMSGEGKTGQTSMTITLANHTNNWGDGSYILRVTANPAYSTCDAVVKDVPFTIKPIPVLNSLTETVAVCEKTDHVASFAFKMTGATGYTFYLAEEPTINGSGTITSADGTGTITFDPSNLPQGTYTLHVQGQSGDNCPSNDDLSAQATLIVNAQPEVHITGTPVQACGEDGAELQVAFTHTGASTYTCTLWNKDYTSAVKTVNGDATGSLTIPTGAQPLGAYHVVLTALSDKGCPSEPDTVDVTLKAIYVEMDVTNAAICYGGLYDWIVQDCNGNDFQFAHMADLTKSPEQLKDTLPCNNGQCNLVYTLNLTVYPEYSWQDAPYTLCAGDTLFWRGKEITAGGPYETKVEGAAEHGCDSIYRIVVNQIQPKVVTNEETAYFCYGEPVNFFGTIKTDLPSGPQTLRDTLRDESGSGCDTLYHVMNIIVGPNPLHEQTETACGTYTWSVNGKTYTESGIYTESFTDEHGCDLTHVLNLTINPSYDSTKVYTILEDKLPYTVHGHTFTAAAENYEIADRTANNLCDSIYRVTLIVTPKPEDVTEVTICEADAPYHWVRLGKDYGSYSTTTQVAKKEDDSIHTLHLTVVKPIVKPESVTACETFTWDVNGETYTTTGERTFIVPSPVNGCDSIIHVLDLTIDHNEAKTEDVTVCQGKPDRVGSTLKVWDADETFSETTTKSSGCTSTVTYNVHVATVDIKPVETAVICQGEEYPWRGQTCIENRTYSDTVWYTDNGCAKEIYTLQLTVNWSNTYENPVHEATIEKHPDALPFEWHGQLLTETGDYYDPLHTINGCDSIVHVYFKVGIVTRDTVNTSTTPLIGCESVEWNSHTYTESHNTEGNLASDTVWYTNADGDLTYDQIHYCYVEVYHNIAIEEPAFNACQNVAFQWHGEEHSLTTVGDQLLTYVGHNDLTGCDTTYTVTVHVAETIHKQEPAITVCPSELPYLWHKQWLTATGEYTDAHTSINGCDSTYVVNFTVKTVVPATTTEATICQGKSYDWKKAGVILMTIPGNEVGLHEYYYEFTDNGCDVKDTLRLTVTSPATPIVTNATICHGESYDWIVPGCDGVTPVTLMKGLTETTHQVMTLDCEGDECNPIYELNLTAYPEYAAPEETHLLCAGETFLWHDRTITEAGTYEWNEAGAGENGCPLVHRVVVTKLEPEVKTISQHVCYGEPVIFNGQSKTLNVGKHELRDTIASAVSGCDSLYLVMNLTVGERYYDSITVAECDEYVWAVNGHTYTRSGIYREVLGTADGCDSIFVLNLTINPSYLFEETYYLSEAQLPFSVHEYTYPSAGTFDRTFRAVGGCDSTYRITINIVPVILPQDTTHKTICANAVPFEWSRLGNNYGTYEHSGWYSKAEEDSIHVLHLTVNRTYSDTTYVRSCGAYTWYGKDYTATGKYTHVATSSCGCDSIEVLALTIEQPTASTVNITACQYEPVSVGSHTFIAMADESFVETQTNAAGCEHTVTYNMTVQSRTYTALETASFCEGTEFAWRGHTYTESGTYYDTLFYAEGGCAQEIHTLELTSKPTYRIDEDVEVWEDALPYAWLGHKGDTLLRTNGDYFDYLTTQGADPCDSIHHIHFHVNWVTRDTVQMQGCESVTWDVNGKTYTESGLYSDTVFTDAPANTQYSVVHFCDVTIHAKYSVEEPEFTICAGTPFEWHGQQYAFADAGEQTLTYTRPLLSNGQPVDGCDSTWTVKVQVSESLHVIETPVTICTTQLPYEWHGRLLTEGGHFTDEHLNIHGCDSIYEITLTVKDAPLPNVKNDTICKGSELSWPEYAGVTPFTIKAEIPGEYTYFKNIMVSDEDCDSTLYQLNLVVGETYEVGKDTTVHICQGESYLWYGEYRTVVTLPATPTEETYTAEFDTVKTSIFGCDSLAAHLTLVMHTGYNVTVPEVQTVCNYADWGEMHITESGTYTQTFNTIYGCNDSVVTCTFEVIKGEHTEETLDICGDSYRWAVNNTIYTESGTYTHEVEQLDGSCNAFATLNLTLRKPERDTVTVTNWCEKSYPWGETHQTYDASGIYEGLTFEGAAANGCDVIHYLRLELWSDSTVNHEYEKVCATSDWQGYEWHGEMYTSTTVARYAEKSRICSCDSIITYLHLTVEQAPEKNVTLEACREFINDYGENYTTTTDDVIYLPSVTGEGCDTVVHRHIIVNQPVEIEHTLAGCVSVTWNNETYFFSDTYTQEFDCDSVVTLNVTVHQPESSDIYETAWDSYTWTEGTGETYTTSGIYVYNDQTIEGCESITTLHLTINQSESDEETQYACESFTWDTWTGGTYTESGDYTETWTNHPEIGRDSTRILHLFIDHKELTAKADTACDHYLWHKLDGTSEQLDLSGTYFYNYKDTACEDNADTLYLVIYHKAVPVEYNDTACGVLTINGKSYFQSTNFSEMLQTEHGCDSLVNYHIVINHQQTTAESESACGSYTWEGTTYTKSGVYNKVLTDINGCDSIVTLTLSIFPNYNREFDAVTCSSHYVWDNRIYETAGDHEWLYQSVNGCDSLVTMHLTFASQIEGATLDTAVCEFIDWNGRRYTEAGSYSETFTSAAGCDSVVWLDLDILPHPTGEFTETAQERYLWRGTTYYLSGDYQQRFVRDEGCDSIVTLHLTITNPLPVTEVADTACDAYTWDSETFYESGVFTRNFPTPDGQDSIVTLSLVINHDTAVSIHDKLCGPYYWPEADETFTETGIYTRTFTRASGCDSVVTLTLDLCERFETSFTATARDVYTWAGETFTSSSGEEGITRVFKSVYGCDSVVTMYLTILSNVQEDIQAQACTQYAWADSIYTQSTIHTQVFTAANGCDSVVTLTLEIHQPVYTDLFDTVKVCDEADPAYQAFYTLPWGEQVNHTGIYTDTLISALSQCDSIVRFNLQWCDEDLCIKESSFTVDDVCEGGVYMWEGVPYSATGTYTRHFRLEDGCDSIVTMRLQMKEQFRTIIDTVACDSLLWRGQWYYETGFARFDTVAANGCDSIVTLHAVIGHSDSATIELTSCDALTLNGETFRESGTYIQHLTTVTGCDSTLTIHLTLNPSFDTIVNQMACDTLFWEGDTLTASGFYPLVLRAENTGCDSVVDLHLIVYGSKEVFVIDSLSCDSLIWGDEYAGIDTLHINGIYTKTFQSAVGCDSTVTMDLRLLTHDEVVAPDTASCDSLIWNDLIIFESDTYKDTLTNIHGCDSIVTMNVTINPTLQVTVIDTVPPPFYLWPTENDTIWESGTYIDTTASFITGCDSITTLYLVMTDSIILDSIEPVRVDTFGYCPGDTVNLVYNLLKGHPIRYTLVFDTVAVAVPDYTKQFRSVLDTTDLPNHGIGNYFTLAVPENCPADTYWATLKLYDDYSSSEEYRFCIIVDLKAAIVSLWTDVIALDNSDSLYIGYQWYIDRDSTGEFTPIPGATKQYYSDGEDLNACYRAKVQLADSSWVFTCQECFDLRTDSLELIAYPTPAPVGQPVTIKALGINIEKLPGSTLTITNVQGLPVKEFTLLENERSKDVDLPAGLYIARLTTGDADDKAPRVATVKFTVF